MAKRKTAKPKVEFRPCICGFKAMYNGTRIATVEKNGSVVLEHDLGKVSSAYPYGKYYVDSLPVEVSVSIKMFAENVARSACSEVIS